jgi:hypothetical protein
LAGLAGPAAEPPGVVDAEKKPEAGRADAPAKVERKIIYTVEATLVVEDFPRAKETLLQLIKDHQGYVAKSALSGTPGDPRSGTWTVRVPVERLDDFVNEVESLGELQRSSKDSQDVTEEYFDVEARLKNKKVEEERLLKHLEKSTGKLEDILAVEKEISRVRGEIERLQGRLQLLANLTSLTTVTVKLFERGGYVPEAAPTFGTSVGRTFATSLRLLADFGKGIVLVVVALAPWLVVAAAVGVPAWLVARRSLRASRAAARRPDPPTVSPA